MTAAATQRNFAPKEAPSSATGAAPVPPKLSMTMNFATAGMGGIIGWCIVHPFNTVAVRMSLATMSAESAGGAAATKALSFPAFFSKTVAEHGVSGLYQGLSAGILRQVFYATSRFGLFEVMRDEYQRRNGSVDIMGRLGCGVASGSIAAFISCPAEVTLVRLSNDQTLPVEKRRNYTGVANAFTRIMSEEGPSAFFRGSGPFVNRAMMVGAVQVGTYDQFRQTYREEFGVKDPIANVFCAAMTSGLLYSLLTMPLETCKNRMAFQKPGADGKLPFTSTTQAIKKIVTSEGLLKLWAGFPPYYLRCGGHTVGMFMAIQQLRALL